MKRMLYYAFTALLCLICFLASAKGQDATTVKGKLVFLGKPVPDKVLILGLRRLLGVPYSPNKKPTGWEVTTDVNGEFTFIVSGKGKYTLYEIRSQPGFLPVYQRLLWYDCKTKTIGQSAITLTTGHTVDIGEVNYIKWDNTRISPRDESVASPTPEIVWGPYPNATSYRVLLFNGPVGITLDAGLDDTYKNADLPLYMHTKTSVSFKMPKPLARMEGDPHDNHTLYVYYFNNDLPIAIGRVGFKVRR
jgi:hypothetical protein